MTLVGGIRPSQFIPKGFDAYRIPPLGEENHRFMRLIARAAWVCNTLISNDLPGRVRNSLGILRLGIGSLCRGITRAFQLPGGLLTATKRRLSSRIVRIQR